MSDFLVPKLLIGTTPQVRKAWLPILRRATREGSWDGVAATLEMVSLREAAVPVAITHWPHNCPSMITAYRAWAASPLDWIPMYDEPVEAMHTRRMSLVQSGLRNGWFALACLDSDHEFSPCLQPQRRIWTYLLLAGLARWWDAICEVEPLVAGPREDGRLRFWWTVPIGASCAAGIPLDTARAAKERAQREGMEVLGPCLREWASQLRTERERELAEWYAKYPLPVKARNRKPLPRVMEETGGPKVASESGSGQGGVNVGSKVWWHYVPYQADIGAALAKLQEVEFAAGRFRGADKKPSTIEAARENAGADSTGSILDIVAVSDEPRFCMVSPMAPEELKELMGTTKPTRKQVEDCEDLWGLIERGMAVYIIVYENRKPKWIFFGGYSVD